MSYLASGKIIHIGEVEQISDTFRKRVIVIEIAGGDQGQYLDEVPFSLMNKATHFADGMQVGQMADLMFSLGGRAWTPDGKPTRWFGENKCFNIKVQGGQTTVPPADSGGLPPTAGTYAGEKGNDPVDEIPF